MTVKKNVRQERKNMDNDLKWLKIKEHRQTAINDAIFCNESDKINNIWQPSKYSLIIFKHKHETVSKAVPIQMVHFGKLCCPSACRGSIHSQWGQSENETTQSNGQQWSWECISRWMETVTDREGFWSNWPRAFEIISDKNSPLLAWGMPSFSTIKAMTEMRRQTQTRCITKCTYTIKPELDQKTQTSIAHAN